MTCVSFIADFGPFQPKEAFDGSYCIVVESPYPTDQRTESSIEQFPLVEVNFSGFIAARMLPGHSDSEVLDPNTFDFKNVPFSSAEGKSIGEMIQGFQNEWKQIGTCPDPLMYEVSDSHWLQQMAGERTNFKHFVLQGHDAYVEVIAERWTWELKRSTK